MSLDRGILAKIDRLIFSELNHTEGTQLVKVPVSDAVWSAWRRYCEVLGIPMGRALAVLLEAELSSVVEDDVDERVSLLKQRLRELSDWEAGLTDREQAVAGRELKLANQESELRRREAELRHHEVAISRREAAPASLSRKPGRNEACWCGSGKKFKYCHGRPSP